MPPVPQRPTPLPRRAATPTWKLALMIGCGLSFIAPIGLFLITFAAYQRTDHGTYAPISGGTEIYFEGVVTVATFIAILAWMSGMLVTAIIAALAFAAGRAKPYPPAISSPTPPPPLR